MLFICLKNLVVIFCLWSHSSELGSLYLMKYPLEKLFKLCHIFGMKTHDSQKGLLFEAKIPKISRYSIFFGLSRWTQISHSLCNWGNVSGSISTFSFFFQDLLAFTTIIFCLFYIIFYLSQVWSRITQLLRAMFLFWSYNDFVFIFSLTGCCGAKVTQNEKWRPFGGRWRNLKTDSIFKLEKEVGLCKPPQVSGYFCLEQKSFLWIVNPHNFVTLS